METHLCGRVFFGGQGNRSLFSDLSGVILFHRMRPAAEFRRLKCMDDGAKENRARNEIEGLVGYLPQEDGSTALAWLKPAVPAT